MRRDARPMLASAVMVAMTSAALLVGCGTTDEPANTAERSGSGVARNLSATSAAGATGVKTSPSIASNPVVDVEPWSLSGTRGSLITTPHYRLYTTLDESVLLSRTPRFLELALAHYTTAIVDLPDPGRPMDSFILATRPQWESVTRRVTGPRASTFTAIRRGGFAMNGRGVYWDIGSHDTLAIAAHEGWHQYTQSTFPNQLPLWLEEGLACYMEGFRWSESDPHLPLFLPWANAERFDQLRKLVQDDRAMSLKELSESRTSDLIRSSGDGALDYYAQVWALVHFLREGEGGRYEAGLRRVLGDAASGAYAGRLNRELAPRDARRAMLLRLGSGPFEIYFERDLAAADAQYDAFMRRIVQTGARQAITDGRSPLRSFGR